MKSASSRHCSPTPAEIIEIEGPKMFDTVPTNEERIEHDFKLFTLA
jgi:hypothetical protein